MGGSASAPGRGNKDERDTNAIKWDANKENKVGPAPVPQTLEETA